MTWGGTSRSRSAVLIDIGVDIVDHELDHVSGVGPANEGIILIIFATSGDEPAAFAEVQVQSDGSWEVNFNEDLTLGMKAVAFLPLHDGFTIGAACLAVVEPEVIEDNSSIVEVSDETEVVVGTVSQNGSLVQVAIPANALPSGSLVRVAAIANTNDLIEQAAVPEGTDVALGFSIGATAADGSDVRVDFATPVSIEFTVEPDTLPAGFDPDSFSIAFWNGVRWAALEDVQAMTNPDGSVMLRALTDHFTLFTVVTDPAGAIRPGSADPLNDVSLPVLGPSEWNQYYGGNEWLDEYWPALVLGTIVTACLAAVVWVIVRRNKKTSGS